MTICVNVSKPPYNPPKIQVVPNPVCMAINQTKQFAAYVTGSTNTSVIWTVASGDGLMSTDGLFTAHDTPCVTVARAYSAADTNVYTDVLIYVNELITDCCQPKVDLVPDGYNILYGGSLDLTLKLDGEDAVYVSGTLDDGTWSYGLNQARIGFTLSDTIGSISLSDGVVTYAAPPSGTVAESVSVIATSLDDAPTCFDTSDIIVSSQPLGITVTPKEITTYVGSTVNYYAEVIGHSNQNVAWSTPGYEEEISNPVSYTPEGTSSDPLAITAPTTVPVYPKIKVRATSIISPNLYDEAILIPIGVPDLSFTTYHCTYYKADEGSGTEDLYLESDPYKGQTIIPNATTCPQVSSFNTGYDYGGDNWQTYSSIFRGINIGKTSLEYMQFGKPDWPDGSSKENHLWMTAYEPYSLPPSNPKTSVYLRDNNEYLSFDRKYKIPVWEKLYLTVDTPGIVVNPSFEFIQQDFGSLGSSIEIVSGTSGLDHVPTVTTTSCTFVYSCDHGFYSGQYGESFNPGADAYDAVRFGCYINMNGSLILKQTIVYFRPEPDLPEILPSIIGPYSGLKYHYFPGEFGFAGNNGIFTNNKSGVPILRYMKKVKALTTNDWQEMCGVDCEKPAWVDGNIYSMCSAALPYKECKTSVSGQDYSLSAESYKWNNTSEFRFTDVPIIMNYYHGRWMVMLPPSARLNKDAIYQRYPNMAPKTRTQYETVVQKVEFQYLFPGTGVGVADSPMPTIIYGAGTDPIYKNFPEGTDFNTMTVRTTTASTIPGYNPASYSGSMDISLSGYQVKLQPIYNRHFMSYECDLVPRKQFPSNINFSLEQLVFDPTRNMPGDYRNDGVNMSTSSVAPYEFRFSNETGTNNSIFTPYNGSWYGTTKVAYIKAVPNIFGGTFTKGTFTPIHIVPMIPISRYNNDSTFDPCNDNWSEGTMEGLGINYPREDIQLSSMAQETYDYRSITVSERTFNYGVPFGLAGYVRGEFALPSYLRVYLYGGSGYVPVETLSEVIAPMWSCEYYPGARYSGSSWWQYGRILKNGCLNQGPRTSSSNWPYFEYAIPCNDRG